MEARRTMRGEDRGLPDVILSLVMSYITDPKDRDSMSQVCRRWYELDSLTRKHVTIYFCYSTFPERLRVRFPHIESLKLKGKPRAAMFNLIPDDWGGFAGPWIRVFSDPTSFASLRSIHLRRMIVQDSDLHHLASTRGRLIHVLKLDKCSGFSTNGLFHIARHCRQLRTLFLEECQIQETNGDWFHELALNNTVLEVLNFYMTELTKITVQDLELIGANCPSLASVKICDFDILDLGAFFRSSCSLKEFCGGSFNAPNEHSSVSLPRSLTHLGLSYLSNREMPLIFPIASSLVKLDLLYVLLGTEDHCFLIERCPNLQVLEARNVIGDRGLESLASNCKQLKRLRIERGDDEQEIEDELGLITQRGLIALSQGCLELEYVAVYVADVTNLAFEHIGTHLKNLIDFRLVLLDLQDRITDLPLDNGVRTLLRGCENLTRFGLYLRRGGLTDLGLKFIGQYSKKVLWMLLGCLGDSDQGLLAFSQGCPSLVKLEMRGCYFSERALAQAVLRLPALRYIWVQGYIRSPNGLDLLPMVRPFWNIELISHRIDNDYGESVNADLSSHILAYYSLAGPRTDYPDCVVPLAVDGPTASLS